MTRDGHRRSLLVLTLVAVLVLGATGGATAGALITGKKIKDGSVTAVDLRNGTLTGLDVSDASLSARSFTAGVVGPEGPEGPVGLPGPAGPQGAAGLRGITVYYARGPVTAPGAATDLSIPCQGQLKALSGGFSDAQRPGEGHADLLQSAPTNSRLGWTVTYRNTGSGSLVGLGWVVCAAA